MLPRAAQNRAIMRRLQTVQWLSGAASAAPSLSRRALLALGLLARPMLALGQSEPFEDESWRDAARAREIPVRLRWPPEALPLPAGGHPVLMFSHGLGGTRAGGEVWGEAWAKAGFLVIHLQHPGSDLEAVRQAGGFADPQRLRSAASGRELMQRLRDVAFALDEVGRRHASAQGRWSNVRPRALGLAGHSFGAHTTLGMAGQSYPGFAGMHEPRLSAFMAFSPTLPPLNPTQALSRLTRPILCLTGTLDGDVLGTGATPEQRSKVFDALPPGHKAQLVLQGADHMSFAGQSGRALEILARLDVSRQLQAQHHSLIALLTSDWWRATLMDDAQAAARLVKPEGLSANDEWRRG